MKELSKWNYDDFLRLLLFQTIREDSELNPLEKRYIIQSIGIESHNELSRWYDARSALEHAQAVSFLISKFCSDRERCYKALNDIRMNYLVHLPKWEKHLIVGAQKLISLSAV